MSQPKVKVAAVQAAPVFLDLEASLQKALTLIEKAAAEGAGLVVFPEAFLPAWPAWVDEVLPGEDAAFHLRLLEQSVVVPGPVTERLGAAAQAAGVHLVMGVNEREANGGTVYNTILYLGADGRLLGRHRKLVPTHAERLVWGMGDGSDLDVHQTTVGRVGGLICWENYMPLARFTLPRHRGRPGGPVLRGARQRPRPRPAVARRRAPRRLDAGRLLGDRRPSRHRARRPAGPRGGHPVRHPRPGRRSGPPPPVRPCRSLQPPRRVPPGRRRPAQAPPGLP